MRRITLLFALVWVALGSWVAADEQSQFNDIVQLLSKQQFDEAETQFQAALKEFPDSLRMKQLHQLFASYFSRAGRHLDAARHADAHVDVCFENLTRSPQMSESFVGAVTSAGGHYVKAAQFDTALEKLAAALDKVEALRRQHDSPELAALVTQLRAKKPWLLAVAERRDEARKLLAEILDEAQQDLEAHPDDAAKALALAAVLQARGEVELGDERDTARQQHLEFLAEQARKRSSHYPLVSAYQNAALNTIMSLARSDAARAEQELVKFEEFLTSLTSDDPRIQNLKATAPRLLSSLKSRIESEKKQQALIGQPAFPLEAEAWVNGEPLTDQDLKGKVVLLDFWAMWCGPCIATFPHLREWQEKFGEQGLVIIGATRHYSYDWDDAAAKIKRVAELSKEDEQKALVRFAAHHELKHRFMVSPDDAFSKKYGVVGIPTAVVIDRTGVIRLLRVGSGEENARDLEAMIEKLLAEPAPVSG